MDRDVEVSIGGRLLLPGGLTDGCIGITGGRIVAIKKILEGDMHYEMPWCLVMPAAVDMHVHFRQPGDAKKGTFESESRAAVFGGVTAVADMPNTQPPAVDLRSWNRKMKGIEGTSYVDYALYMGLKAGQDPELVGTVTGLFKLYIASSTGDLLVHDRKEWADLLAASLEAGGRTVIHAEDQQAIDEAEPSGEELERHHNARPQLGEARAVEQVGKVAMTTGAASHAHVAHVSCKEALAAFLSTGMSAEVSPHHLFLDLRMEELGARGKVNPPLRTDADRAALWAALVEGGIPIMASDHAPHTQEEKALRFEDAPSGIPGVETMVPLAMAQAKNGRIPLERLVDAVSVRPAAFLGLSPRGLEVGNEAHLAVYDPKRVRKVREDDLHQRCGWSPYHGMDALFPNLVVGPMGVLVDDGVFQQNRPAGRYVGLSLEELATSDPVVGAINSSG